MIRGGLIGSLVVGLCLGCLTVAQADESVSLTKQAAQDAADQIWQAFADRTKPSLKKTGRTNKSRLLVRP